MAGCKLWSWRLSVADTITIDIARHWWNISFLCQEAPVHARRQLTQDGFGDNGPSCPTRCPPLMAGVNIARPWGRVLMDTIYPSG